MRNLIGVTALVGVGVVAFAVHHHQIATTSERPLLTAKPVASADLGSVRNALATLGDHHVDRQTERLIPPNESSEMYGLEMPDGTIVRSTALSLEPDESRIDGAVSVRKMMTTRLHDARIIQDGVALSRAERDDCLAGLVKRGGKITMKFDWVIGLRFVSDGKKMSLVEVKAPDSFWPSEFDQEAKDCYLKSFSKISFPSAEAVEDLVEYPLCVYPQ